MKETGFPNNTINIYWGKRVSFNSNRQKLLLETSKKITLLLRFEGCGGWGRRRVVNDREMNFIRHIHECVSNELQLAWVGVVGLRLGEWRGGGEWLGADLCVFLHFPKNPSDWGQYLNLNLSMKTSQEICKDATWNGNLRRFNAWMKCNRIFSQEGFC